jgi:hypothetical protein
MASAHRADPARVFLLSPANCGGVRATMARRPDAAFALARQLRSAAGAPLGDVFSFVSGLYFRGKLAYARRFARPPDPADPVAAGGVLVITPNAGLRSADTLIGMKQFTLFAGVDVDAENPAYRRLLDAVGAECEVVLLGSIASGKYVEVLQPIFGDRLVFPPAFVGRGDMSRGGLMLRCVEAGEELEYAPIAGAVRKGQRPPKLTPVKGIMQRLGVSPPRQAEPPRSHEEQKAEEPLSHREHKRKSQGPHASGRHVSPVAPPRRRARAPSKT